MESIYGCLERIENKINGLSIRGSTPCGRNNS